MEPEGSDTYRRFLLLLGENTPMLDLPIFFLSAGDGFPVVGKEFDFTINAITQENSQMCLEKCRNSDEIVIGIYPHSYSKISVLPLNKQFEKIGPVCYLCQIQEIEELDSTSFVIFSQPIEKIIIETLDFENKIAEIVPHSEHPEYKLSNSDLDSVFEFVSFVIEELDVTSIEEVREIIDSDSFSKMEKIDLVAHMIISDKAVKYVYNQTLNDEERAKELVYYLLNTYEPVNVLPLSKLSSFQSPFSNQSSSNPKASKNDLDKNLPEYVKEKLNKEMTRFKRLPPSSLEAQTALDYIETVQSIPWKHTPSEKELKLDTFSSKLDETHYGMTDIKEKIEEHIALQIHLNRPVGTIMCFCGPPGTGKTSIAKAIAKASNKEIIKIALGGVTDEAEFRGHRRTYVASKPGRIIEGLIKAKTQNPIILLDEVDKLSSNSSKGDPTSALLEILDPEQNEEFIDRYVEVPVDLSKITFIATANYMEKIPKPLLDRLDIIEFRFYTEEERLHILEKYMIPNSRIEYKLEDFDITFKEDLITKLISFKSIRVMEKNLKSIFRHIIKLHLSTGQTKFDLDESFAKFNINTTKTMGFE